MSSSFPVARFPTLLLRKYRGATKPLDKDTVAPTEGPSGEVLIARMCASKASFEEAR
jgi:hypothetical protein